MRKNIFISILLLFIVVFSVSCGNGSSDDTTAPAPILPKTEKITFSDYKAASDYETAGENKYAVRFTASNKLHSFDLHAFAGEGMSRAVVTLYNWSGDYETTVNSKPFDIYSIGPLSKKDIGAVQALMFPSMKIPPAGEYLVVISLSSPNALLLMGEKTEDAEQRGIICYKNGAEYDKTPCMTMAYHQN